MTTEKDMLKRSSRFNHDVAFNQKLQSLLSQGKSAFDAMDMISEKWTDLESTNNSALSKAKIEELNILPNG